MAWKMCPQLPFQPQKLNQGFKMALETKSTVLHLSKLTHLQREADLE